MLFTPFARGIDQVSIGLETNGSQFAEKLDRGIL
jgi:hypothetical protein